MTLSTRGAIRATGEFYPVRSLGRFSGGGPGPPPSYNWVPLAAPVFFLRGDMGHPGHVSLLAVLEVQRPMPSCTSRFERLCPWHTLWHHCGQRKSHSQAQSPWGGKHTLPQESQTAGLRGQGRGCEKGGGTGNSLVFHTEVWKWHWDEGLSSGHKWQPLTLQTS